MKPRTLLPILALLLLFSARAQEAQNDRNEIISLIFNEEIGKFPYLGWYPPVPPFAPDREVLLSYENEEEARKHLTSDEWKLYFEDRDSAMIRWKNSQKAVLKIKRKIILSNGTTFSNNDNDMIKSALQNVSFGQDIIDATSKWYKTDITNNSIYEIIDGDEAGQARLDSLHVGIMSFSEVGFNDKKDEAVIYYDWFCGGHCGGGTLVFLKKEKGIWIITESRLLWVS